MWYEASTIGKCLFDFAVKPNLKRNSRITQKCNNSIFNFAETGSPGSTFRSYLAYEKFGIIAMIL